MGFKKVEWKTHIFACQMESWSDIVTMDGPMGKRAFVTLSTSSDLIVPQLSKLSVKTIFECFYLMVIVTIPKIASWFATGNT